MNTNFNLLFYLKKPKTWDKGSVPIYIRITVDGRRTELSAGRECDPAKWNNHAGRAIGTKADIKALNSYLDVLQHNMRIAHQTLIENRQTVTAEALKNQFTGKTESNRYLMVLLKSTMPKSKH